MEAARDLAVLSRLRTSDLCHVRGRTGVVCSLREPGLGRVRVGGGKCGRRMETAASKGLMHWPANLHVHEASLQ